MEVWGQVALRVRGQAGDSEDIWVGEVDPYVRTYLLSYLSPNVYI